MTSNHHDYDPFRSANSSGAYQVADDAWVKKQRRVYGHYETGDMIQPPEHETASPRNRGPEKPNHGENDELQDDRRIPI